MPTIIMVMIHIKVILETKKVILNYLNQLKTRKNSLRNYNPVFQETLHSIN